MGCEKCHFKGFIEDYPKNSDGEYDGTIIRYHCECRIYDELNEQAEKAWAGLSKIPVDESRLDYKEFLNKDTYVTADLKNFALSLRSALWGLTKPALVVKLVDDTMLMSVWLQDIHENGKKVIDPDFDYETPLRDIRGFIKPDLLIIRLGVKSSRNVATPEVLLEVLENRKQAFKPTWIVDSQDKPFRQGHISWSNDAERMVNRFARIDMTEKIPVNQQAVSRLTPSLSSTTTVINTPVKEDTKPKKPIFSL